MIVRKTTDEVGMNSNAIMGLSGLDTASMLKSMMKPYKIPITSLSQKQQIVVWKQERYRELITKLNDFKAKFFDFRNPATNINSSGTWKKFLIDNPGNEYVEITSTTTSKPKSGSIEIQKMPTASTITGRSGLMKEVIGVSGLDWTNAAGSFLTINMDGIVRSIPITSAMAAQPTNEDSRVMLQNAIDSAFGAGMIITEIFNDGGVEKLKLTANPTEVNQFTIIDGGVSTARVELGFGGSSNLSNKVVLSDTLDALSGRMNEAIQFKTALTYDSNGAPVTRDVVEFMINGVSFQFSKFDSVKTVMDTINNSGCGVNMSYDNAGDSFKLTSAISGPGENILIKEEETNFFSAIGLGFVDEDTADPAINIFGGVIDPGLVSTVNAWNTPGTNPAYEFIVTVNGVQRTITLDRTYVDENDMIGDINAQLAAAFPTAGVSIGVSQSTVVPTDWYLVLNIDKTAPNAAWSFQVDVDPGNPAAGILSNFGLDVLSANVGALTPQYSMGEFGKVVIDGVILQVDRPTFEYDGVLYSLKKLPPPGSDPIEYSIKTDTDKIVDLVREFVDAYNELVRAIGEALGEKRDKDNAYPPLTDEQKADMSEKEIEKWEAKAKIGLLRGDVHFISLSSKLRLSVFNPVYEKYGDSKPISYSLKKMGIDTKDSMSMFNPADNGALFIDEEVLRYAIETNLDQIALLFTKTPDTFTPGPEDADKPAEWKARMQRIYDDSTGGLATKITNILDDYIRTMRGSNNAKGVLIERAGVENDTSDLYNTFTKEILEYDRRINALWERYDRIEKQKIQTLSRLETVIQNAATQIDWMQGQLGQQ